MPDEPEISYRRRRAAGAWLRRERERRGMTAEDLAGRINVRFQQVSNYELGKSRIDDERAEAIAHALGLPVLEVRRHLGLWTPDGYQPDPYPGVEAAIRADPYLSEETKAHLLRQYRLLLRVMDEAEAGRKDAEQAHRPSPPATRPGEPDRKQSPEQGEDVAGW